MALVNPRLPSHPLPSLARPRPLPPPPLPLPPQPRPPHPPSPRAPSASAPPPSRAVRHSAGSITGRVPSFSATTPSPELKASHGAATVKKTATSPPVTETVPLLPTPEAAYPTLNPAVGPRAFLATSNVERSTPSSAARWSVSKRLPFVKRLRRRRSRHRL